MSDYNFELDPQIRNWVLFPITLVMLLVGILRHYVVMLLKDPPKQLTKAATREQRALARSQILRATAPNSPIAKSYYSSITTHLCTAFEAGEYLKDGPPKEGEPSAAPPNPLTDPAAMDGMMSGMKTQMVMMVPQMVIMGWINFFFSGFVLIKLPFPLTSLSWYFLNLFGLNGVYRLILGNDNAADSSQSMTQSPFATTGAATATGPVDYVKIFKAEIDNLQLSEGVYKWAGEGVEERVLKMYGKL
ncbi:transmembrane protein [Flagelloscypha sp. PMI_526]|nr:transmembrane protein [Flagelloscypha sp. PMI_526]